MRAPNPRPNPLRDAPPPGLPPRNRGGRPPKPGSEAWKRQQGAQAAQAPPPAYAPPPAVDQPWSLPEDPVERKRVLDEVDPDAQLVLALLSVVASRLPPARPLSEEERTALEGPLKTCLVKWTSDLSPEWKLAGAVAGIALGRYMEAMLPPELVAPQPQGAKPAATIEGTARLVG